MTKPVVGLTVFGSNTSGTTTQLDNNFSALQTAINDLNTFGNFLTDTGAANAMAVTLPANITGALTNGLPIQVRVAATNTGATVINYNATGNANVVNLDGTSLTAGQLLANSIVLMQFSNAIGGWYLQTPVPTSATGSYVLLSNKQANANASIDFNVSMSSAYDNYQVFLSGVVPQNQNTALLMRFAESGANYVTTVGGYAWERIAAADGGAVSSSANTAANSIQIETLLGNTSNNFLSADITLFGMSGNSVFKGAVINTIYRNSTTFVVARGSSSGVYSNSNANLSSVQFLMNSGNIMSGNFALYGIRKS